MASPLLRIPVTQADAFTHHAFAGNPAAVCRPDASLDADLMQAIAKEMNLSETAFVTEANAEGVRGLRWFTPGLEVDLCGHATLATAHVLYEGGASAPLRFHTRSGELRVDRTTDGALLMDFPAVPHEVAVAPMGLLEALGVRPDCWSARGPVGQYWMVVLDSEDLVRRLTPDFGALGGVALGDRIGVAVTARGNETDFVSRFFAPWAGIDEDPVTGSAHCMLAPFWGAKLGKKEMTARQIGPRPGEMVVRTAGDRVHLIGHAVTVMEGTLTIPASTGA